MAAKDGTEQIVGAIQDALDHGKRIDVEELKRRFPSHVRTIERLIALEDRIRGASSEPLEGARVGPYRLVREIGRGGMARVYEAYHAPLNRTVALKLLRGLDVASDAVVRRFHREAEATARLSHPGIVTIHDYGVDPTKNAAFIAMELVEGLTLAATIERLGALGSSEPTAVQVMRIAGIGTQSISEDTRAVDLFCRWTIDLARALHAAHDAGIVHRDVKPGNVLIRKDGRVVVTDFGIALLEDLPGLTRSQDFLGTPAYMSPEQLARSAGGVDRRSDVYSLGVLLYECLTLRRPHQATSGLDMARLILEEEPPRPSRLSRGLHTDLDTIVLKALQKDPDRRYSTAAELADDLGRFLRHEPIAARPAGLVTRAHRFSRRHRPWVLAVAGSLLVLGALSALDRIGKAAICREKTQAALAVLADLRREVRIFRATIATSSTIPELPETTVGRLSHVLANAREIRLLDSDHSGPAEIALGILESGRSLSELHGQLVELTVSESTDVLNRNRAYERGETGIARPPPLVHSEKRLEELRSLRESTFQDALVALQMAAALDTGAAGPPLRQAVDEALARLYLPRYLEQVGRDDARTMAARRARILALDPLLEDRLSETGKLTISTDPPGASVYLFRYESLASLEGRAPDRLVPVACDWNRDRRPLDAERTGGIRPGDQCLVVEAINATGAAGAAGLEVGDIIMTVDSRNIGASAYAWFQPEHSPAPNAITPFDRIVSIEGVPVESPIHAHGLLSSASREKAETVNLEIEKVDATRRVIRVIHTEAIRPVSEEEFLMYAPDAQRPSLELTVVRDGRRLSFRLAGGENPGFRVWTTSSPLPTSSAGLFGTTPLYDAEIPIGSYLVLLRRDDYEDQRYPIRVVNGETREVTTIDTALNPIGTTPPGFVFIPQFTAIVGGDSRALRSSHEETVTFGPLFVARDELSVADYARMITHPEAQRMISESPEMEWSSDVALLPKRTDEYQFAKAPKSIEDVISSTLLIRPDGTLEPWLPPWYGLRAVALTDAEFYCDWRNAIEVITPDSKRSYRLLSGEEWEAAARGADGRAFPWGNSFDWSFVFGYHSVQLHRESAPLVWPTDESPFGIRNMAGGTAVEWCRRPIATHEDRNGTFFKGGSCANDLPAQFRCASQTFHGPNQIAAQTTGIRLCFESGR